MTEGTPVSKDAERRARLQAAMRGAGPSAPRTPPPAPVGSAGPAGLGHGGASAPVAGRRSPVAYVADRRGLTVVGIVLLELIGGFVGLAHDLNTGSHILGTVTAIAFATATVVA